MSFATVRPRFNKYWLPVWLMALLALGYAGLFMHLSGGGLDHLYSRSLYHRLQAEALLHGQFGIADSIYQMSFDLAWHDGQVQQIWGLGVGLWLAPFVGLFRCCGGEVFPDRVALGVAVFLYALYSGVTALRLGHDWKSKGFGFGIGFLVLFFPPFWILAMAPQLIYDETILYACLASQSTLTALVRFVVFRRQTDYLLCCLLATFAGLIRPTHFIYGFVAITLASTWQLYGKPRSRLHAPKSTLATPRQFRWAALGVACFLSGVLFLLWSNKVRFGSPFEFGHRITGTAMPTVFFSRFSAPYSWQDSYPLAKELFAWIFLPPLKLRPPWDGNNLVYFQAPVSRWRDIYYPTFNPVYLAFILLGLAGSVVHLIRRFKIIRSNRRNQTPFSHQIESFSRPPRRSSPKTSNLKVGVEFTRLALNRLSHQPIPRTMTVLWLWTLLCFPALFVVYLRMNSMSSRYVMDFAPAILAGVLLGWGLLIRRWPRLTLVLTLIAVGIDLARVREVPIFNQPTTVPYIRDLAPSLGSTIDEFNGAYDQDAHPAETQLLCNGYGWAANGMAGPTVMLAVDAPQFLELTVGPHLTPKAEPDIYRARIGLIELPIVSTNRVSQNLRIRFALPDEIRRRAGDELVFLCFTKTILPSDLNSRRRLVSVKWR